MRTVSFVLFFSCLLLTSCKNGDTLLQSTTGQIARSWSSQTSTALSVATGQSFITYKRSASPYDLWINLAPNGVSSEYIDGQADTGTWELVDKQLNITVPGSTTRTYEVEAVSSTNLTLLYVVLNDTQDSNQKAFLSTMKNMFGLDVSKGVKLTIQYSAR